MSAPRANIRYQPIIDNPTDWEVVKNIRPTGWLLTAAWGVAGGIGGYVFGMDLIVETC
jgi:hypothetical protein